MIDILNTLTKYTADIDATIKDILAESPDFIRGVINYHIGWVDSDFKPASFDRGKMFRPTICLLIYEALTGQYKAALSVAASIELIHNFSLLHDDIEDGDTERRGRPTAWTIWGKPLVINVGDHLYSLAYRAIHHLDPNQFSSEQILAVFRLINRACIALTEGQDLDIRFETLSAVSTEMYLDMVYKKTGALVEAAILAGATLGTTNQAILENYYQFARSIGIAFQIRDDMLGIWGDTTKTGKSATNDLYRKKKTLPIIYLLAKASGRRKEKLQAYYADSEPLSDEGVAFVRDCLAWAEAYDYTQNMANNYQKNAFQALDRLDLNNQPHLELEAIARFLIDRSH